MAYATQFTIATNSGFKDKVTVSMLKVAITVQAESSGVVNHNNRSAFARAVLADPLRFTPSVALAIVSDDSTGINATDAAIDTRMTAIWDALSGVI
jgi:hypothetical protein